MAYMGWSLPAGCGTLPGEEDEHIFPEEEEILELLENAGTPSEVNDKVCLALSKALSELAWIRMAMADAAARKLCVRFDRSELSTTSGHFVEVEGSEHSNVSDSFVRLLQAINEDAGDESSA